MKKSIAANHAETNPSIRPLGAGRRRTQGKLREQENYRKSQ